MLGAVRMRIGAIKLKRADFVFALAAFGAFAAIGAARPSPEPMPAKPAMDDAPKPFVNTAGPALQCVAYARERSGIEIYGDAQTWWAQADGRYRRSSAPAIGAVIVMGGTEAGHVGVVTHVLNARQIAIDHANWLGHGEIITGALVEDASPAGDWSTVRVWNAETQAMGARAYPVFGFVLPDAA